MAHGIGNQFLITYSGWTDYINTHPANTMRIWEKFYPFIGSGWKARALFKREDYSSPLIILN
ncbi:MAG: hypothetical protein ABIK99_03575 [candidate division WOR-3 bacterium]